MYRPHRCFCGRHLNSDGECDGHDDGDVTYKKTKTTSTTRSYSKSKRRGQTVLENRCGLHQIYHDCTEVCDTK